VLATSREPLAIRGEVLHAVTPLLTPEPDRRHSAGDVARYESAALFLARTQATMPDVVLTDANAAVVTELCRRLEGLPLAIELATAWVRTLEPQQILDRLVDRFALLSASSSPIWVSGTCSPSSPSSVASSRSGTRSRPRAASLKNCHPDPSVPGVLGLVDGA